MHYLPTTHIFSQSWKSNPKLGETLGDSPVHFSNLIDAETPTQRREVIYPIPQSKVLTDLLCFFPSFLSFALFFINVYLFSRKSASGGRAEREGHRGSIRSGLCGDSGELDVDPDVGLKLSWSLILNSLSHWASLLYSLYYSWLFPNRRKSIQDCWLRLQLSCFFSMSYALCLGLWALSQAGRVWLWAYHLLAADFNTSRPQFSRL